MTEEKEKEKTNQNKSLNNTKEIIFESTYEKVLFIINKVKDYIQSIKDNETSKLIEELDWVIKVITNRDLYTYELVKEKLMKQDEGYDKFINFVKKYNEEVIEMNKKHNIVSSILNIRKKEEILLKPSLFLKKMEDVEEFKDKKKNNFVQTFGNYILNLYNEKNKKDDNNSNILNNNSSKADENSNNINEPINKNENSSLNLTKPEESKKDNSQNNNNKIIKPVIPNQKKINLENNKIIKKDNFDKTINTTTNIQKLKISNKKMNLKSKSNTKIANLEMQELAKKKYKEKIKLSRVERNNFNQIKNLMRNYYLNFAFNEQFISNSPPHLFKTDFNNHKQNNNVTPLELFKRYKYNQEKSYNLYKTTRFGSLPYNFNFNIKNKYAFSNSKISLSLQANNDTNDERHDKINHKVSKNYFKTEKIYIPSKSSEKKKTLINKNIKIENNNAIKEHHSKIKNNFNISSKKMEKHFPLQSLVDDNYEELKMISTLDFNIFNLKKKIGYSNVLPLMGYTMLQTLGLVNNKIISTKKLESFLNAVSDNYKITTLYHNSIHGADVTQTLLVFCLNSNVEEICETTVLDLLGMILSSIGHDLGHPGLNNGYHINASTELGITYNDISCLENFHSAFLFKIIRKEENNILEKFSVQNYKTIRKRMISQILATDMAKHGEICSPINSKIKTRKDQERFIFLSGNDKSKFDEQQLLLNYLIHMADLGHNCKKFEISFSWVKLLCEEFWDQGDKEKEKGLPISFMCDRNNVDIPTSQIGFIKGFILPSFDALVEMFPKLKFTTENAENNVKQWTKFQSEKRLLGWTPEKDRKKRDENDKDEK